MEGVGKKRYSRREVKERTGGSGEEGSCRGCVEMVEGLSSGTGVSIVGTGGGTIHR